MSIIPHMILDDAECRICFETHSTLENPLMSPCMCRGTSKWVHKECIQRWRNANPDTPNFLKCNTCGQEYQFKSVYPHETYIFNNFIIDRMPGTYWYSLGTVFCLSALIRPIDKYFGFQGLYFITNFKSPNEDLRRFFIDNEIYNLDYIFCMLVFLFTCIAYITLFLRITANVKKKKRYWYHAGLQHMSLFILSLHLLYFGFICNGRSKNIEGLITFETLLSSMNILLFGAALSSHNNTIEKMNSINTEEIQNFVGGITV